MPAKISISFRAINVFADGESHLEFAWLANTSNGGEGRKKIFKHSLALNHPYHYSLLYNVRRSGNWAERLKARLLPRHGTLSRGLFLMWGSREMLQPRYKKNLASCHGSRKLATTLTAAAFQTMRVQQKIKLKDKHTKNKKVSCVRPKTVSATDIIWSARRRRLLLFVVFINDLSVFLKVPPQNK